YAAALWLIKENKFQGTDEQLQESFLSFLETNWKNDALILKENYEGDMDKKTFSRLKKEFTIIDELAVHRKYMEKINSLLKDYHGKFKWRDEVLYVTKEIEKDVRSIIRKIGAPITHDEIQVSPNPMKERYEEGTDEYKKHTKKMTPGQEEVAIDEEVFYWYIIKGNTQKGKVAHVGTERQMKLMIRKPTFPSNHVLMKSRKRLTFGDKWKGSYIPEEVELVEMKWEVGVVYHQEFQNGDRAYFRADSVLKNKRWKGMQVDEFGGKQKKAKNATANENLPNWETTPKNEIPKGLKEEVEVEEGAKFSASQLDTLKTEYSKLQKINPESPAYKKMKAALGKMSKEQLKQIKDAKIKFMQFTASELLRKMGEEVELEEGTWALPSSQTDYDNLMKIMKKPIPAGKAAKLLYGITGDDVLFDAIGKVEDNNKNADVRSLVKDFLKQPNVKKHMKKHGIKEEVELEEVFNVGKMSDAKLKAFIGQFDPDERMGMAAAMQLKAAKKEARKRGIKEEVGIDEKVKPAKDVGLECMECGHKFRHKNPKYGITKCPKCKSTDLDLQFGEEVKVDEVKSDYEDAIAAFKAKGGNVKKLKPGKKFKSLFKQKGPKKLPRQAEEVEVDEDAKMGKQTDDNLRKIYKKALAADQSSPANEFMTKRIAKEMKKRGIKEKVEISEGRPKIVDPTAPRTGDREKQLRVAAQNKKYKPEEVANIARKHKVRMDGEPVPGELPNDWLIAVRGGIILDYDYKNNMTYIKGWKVDRKKIRTHITKYEQGGSSYEDLIGVGRVLGLRGFESAFELIGEELQLKEQLKPLPHWAKDLRKKKKESDLRKKKKESQKEEAPSNNIGSGNVNIDPHLKKKKKVKTEEFSGNKVFVVSAQRFHDSRLGKARYARYEKYVGNDEVGEAIRLYGRSNPKLPIILKNSENGAMLYLKYGSKR
ncbi:MAG: hypothetical protein QGH83_02180, partial [Candidatus Pacebacteria bacterium]|nr:hypothetical protein [Candidatus Paceibacterota bacterium]